MTSGEKESDKTKKASNGFEDLAKDPNKTEGDESDNTQETKEQESEKTPDTKWNDFPEFKSGVVEKSVDAAPVVDENDEADEPAAESAPDGGNSETSTEAEVEKERKIRALGREIESLEKDLRRKFLPKEGKEMLRKKLQEKRAELALLKSEGVISPDMMDEWKKDVVEQDAFWAIEGLRAIQVYEREYARMEKHGFPNGMVARERSFYCEFKWNELCIDDYNRLARIVARYSKHGEALAKYANIPEDEYKPGGKSIMAPAEGDGKRVGRIIPRMIGERAYFM